MVFVNEKKFACEACIKGHRSSSCHHTERPLFEVKRKGRPVSQCTKCRELRQAKRVHSKCTCTPRQPATDKVPIPAARPDKKPRRFMPSVPTLPNGISDALQSSTVSPPPDARQRVDSLLNPCLCTDVRQCTCRRTSCHAGPSFSAEGWSDYGLQALAEAAAARVRDLPIPSTAFPRSSNSPPRSCCTDEPPTALDTFSFARLEPPPIHVGPTSPATVPDFATNPALCAIKYIAESGCTCDSSCTCPGCIQHRTVRHAEKHHNDCREGCGHCVDRSASIELPLPGWSQSCNLVDLFFARAAALPSPPPNRRPAELVPGDVTVYPSDLFLGSSVDADNGRGSAFGLVKIPKLECCRGQCNCPADGCQCRRSCSGGCGASTRS